MGEKEDVAALKRNVTDIYNRKRSAVYDLCKMYAGLSLQRFRQKQAQDAFFHNRTNTAYNSAKSDAELTKAYCEFFLYLSVEYGVYLELANNRKYESVRPTVMAFYSRFMRDLEALFAD